MKYVRSGRNHHFPAGSPPKRTDVDEQNTHLIVALQLADLEQLRNDKIFTSSDEQVARETYRTELVQYRGPGFNAGSATLIPDASIAPLFASTIRVPRTETFRCVVCDARFDANGCWRASCKHYYCKEDLGNLFRLSLTDSALYPPSCCSRRIPFEAVKQFLQKDLAKRYADRKDELDDEKPTYCHVPTCSTYITQDDKVGLIAMCPKCCSRTCISCKLAAHEGDCAEDEATMQVLDIAKENGWRRCPKCERMVELYTGCNHIT